MPPRSSDYVENHRETNSWYGNLVLAETAPAAAAPPRNRVWGGGPRARVAANAENTTWPGGAAANDPEGEGASPPRARVPAQAAETPAILVEPTRTLLWQPPEAVAPTAGGLPETETNLAALAASVTMDEADLQQQQQQDGLNVTAAAAAAPLALVSPLLPRPPPAIQRRAYNHPHPTTTNAFAFPGMLPQQPPLLQFHPIATTLDDLKRAAEHCDLADLIDATCLHGATATPRLACLGLQLLAERASTASSDLRAVFSVRIVRQLLQLLWQPLDWLTQEWAAHVLQRLSTDDLMDQRLLVDVARSNNHHEPNLLTVLAQVLRGDGGEQRRDFAPPCDAPLPTSVTPIGVVSSVTGSPRPAPHHEAPASTATTTTTPLSHHLSANDQPQPAAEDSWPVGTPATQSFTLTPAALPPFPMLGGGAKATTMSPVISTLSPRFNNHNNTAHGMMVTQQTRVHAAITLMNLSCGSGSPANVEVHSNKAMIASNTALLLAIRDVLWEAPPPLDEHRGVWNLLRLKLVIGVKNLATLPEEACGGNLLRCPCLVRGLGHLILTETTASLRAAPAITSAITVHAIQAVSNLSAAKEFKSHIYHTPGLVQSLMIVLTRETKPDDDSATREARVRALSVLANLAISYDNKLSMYHYPGLLGAVCHVVTTSMKVEAKSEKAESNHNPGAVVALRRRLLPKACSILWSLAAEKENQVPLVQSGLNVPQMLIQVATANHDDEDSCCCCLARPKCLAALTLLAESPANAMPLLQAGILCPLLACLQQGLTTEKRGVDNHTCVSWSVSCLMNLAQVDRAIPLLLEAGVVELLAPFVLATASTTNDSSNNDYQRLKAAMAVTLCCRLPKGSDGRSSSAAVAQGCIMDRHYNVLRKVETYIPEMIELLDNTLSGQGGPGYKYGVFTLSSCVACLASLASGPDFWREQLHATTKTSHLLWSSLLRVLLEFGEGGPGSIVGGGQDDVMSARWAMQALHAMTRYLRDMSDDKTQALQLPVGGSNNAAASFTEALQRALNRAHQRFSANSALVQTAVHNQQTAAMVESMSEPEKGAVLGAGMAVRTLQLLLGSRRHHVVPSPVAAQTRGDEEEEEDAKPRSCRTVHGGTKRPACSLSIPEPQQATSSSSFDLDPANSHDNAGSRDGEYVLWSPVSVVVAAAGTLEDPQRAHKRTKRAPFLPPKTAQSPPPP